MCVCVCGVCVCRGLNKKPNMLGLDRLADTKERRGTFLVGHFLNLKGLK